MADEHKHEEFLPDSDPAVEVVERESLMEKISEKIHHKAADVRWCATVAWVLFELMEYHLLTLLCYVMIVALAVLFLWSNVSTKDSSSLVLLFTVPLIYDKYEDKIDSYGEKAMA
ncbi:hypothetical protein F2Q70_00029856 [Brassica cretica]|uniref:Reticulon-like protein n=1 Tax=Brassica cretica TaxID=69181 RepID=A0A8S9FNH1_BRACR|nr:hypothetical protein F2Q70_00029856 [Brassica cretica]KAF2553555.1 hypothetical protein F2Q68_00034326 [Brassica cretica]